MSVFIEEQQTENITFYSELQEDEVAGVTFKQPVDNPPLTLTIKVAEGGLLSSVEHPNETAFSSLGSYWKFLGIVTAKIDELIAESAGAGAP